MSQDDDAKPLDALLDKGATVMIVTPDAQGRLGSCPITVAAVDGTRLRHLIDTTAEWTRALSGLTSVHLTFTDTRGNAYASLNGRPSVSTADADIDELWNPFADAFFDDGRQSAGIAVLDVEIDDGLYWTGPSGRLGSLISLVKAKVGDAEDAGEHGPVDA